MLVGMVTSSLATFFLVNKKEDKKSSNKNVEFIKSQLDKLDELFELEIM